MKYSASLEFSQAHYLKLPQKDKFWSHTSCIFSRQSKNKFIFHITFSKSRVSTFTLVNDLPSTEIVETLILDHVSGRVSAVKAISWGTSVLLIMVGCFLICLCRGKCLFCIPECLKEW